MASRANKKKGPLYQIFSQVKSVVTHFSLSLSSYKNAHFIWYGSWTRAAAAGGNTLQRHPIPPLKIQSITLNDYMQPSVYDDLEPVATCVL